jgi:hypothetical protein
MGEWGARWLELEPHHSDPAYVLFATSRLVDVERAPPHGLVVRFELGDRHYWLLVRARPVCTSCPGRVEDLVDRTRSEVLARCHLATTTFAQAERGGQLEIDGPGRREAFLDCIREPIRRRRERGGVVVDEQPPAARQRNRRGGGSPAGAGCGRGRPP